MTWLCSILEFFLMVTFYSYRTEKNNNLKSSKIFLLFKILYQFNVNGQKYFVLHLKVNIVYKLIMLWWANYVKYLYYTFFNEKKKCKLKHIII